jgi:uncharacterized phage protein (TIGR01671 family)
MKREIKFRAWNYEDNEMLRDIADGMMIQMNSGRLGWYDDDANFIECDYPLMQFTGLKDKNGKEIYEGDVVKTETEKAMQVSWNTHFASFCLDRSGWMFTHYFGEGVNPEQIEVIGNIYENPELLKP